MIKQLRTMNEDVEDKAKALMQAMDAQSLSKNHTLIFVGFGENGDVNYGIAPANLRKTSPSQFVRAGNWLIGLGLKMIDGKLGG